MPTSLSIPKNPVYPATMDFQRLRREGIRHIERLGSAIWTDYNDHDPGITMLEVLDYAITDLGYRTNWPAADLFALPGQRKPYPTAVDILTNGPVTALDIRKLLIDLDGVRNAWIECQSEPVVLFELTNDLKQVNGLLKDKLVAVYGDFIDVARPVDLLDNTVLKNLQTSLKNWADAKDGQTRQTNYTTLLTQLTTAAGPLATSYLAQALLLFTVDQRLDEINLTINRKIQSDPTTDTAGLTLLQTHLNELNGLINDYRKAKDPATLTNLKTKLAECTSDVTLPDLSPIFIGQALLELLLTTGLIVVKKPEASPAPTPPDDSYNLFTPRGIYTVLLEIDEANEEDVDTIKRNALARLHAYRNLCEDIDPVIKILDTEFIGVCATLEFTPDADPNAVLAAVIDAIDNFLAPPVRFYTLQERLDKYGRFRLSDQSLTNLSDAALPTDLLTALQTLANQDVVSKQAFLEAVRLAIGDTALADYEALIFFHTEKNYDSHPVYQGPLLDHGFIDEDELEAAQLRRTVYKSDLYQVILQVAGVVGIQSLEMGKCRHNDDGSGTLDKADWCVSFDCECQIRFDPDCSTFHYAKGNSYTRLDTLQATQQVRWLQLRQNFSVVRKDDMDLAPPSALFRPDFLDYTSVQEDFPLTYHIGRDGLASSESPLRKAQAKQLKGYLLFYDQILANYLAQLAKVRELLAIDGTDRFPAGFLPLTNIVPNVKPLLNDTYTTDNAEFNELMQGVELDQQLYQSRLMDHLLARFGEQFTDYVLTLYQTDKLIDDGDLVGNGLADWIADKQNLLANLPRLGRERARGFNYRARPEQQNAHIWKPEEDNLPPSLFANVEGLKQRVCALLGIEDASRHTITCEPDFVTDVFLSPEPRARRYRFGVKAEENDPMYILISTAWYAKADLADIARQGFENLSLDTSHYDVIAEPNTDRFVLAFWAKSTSTALRTYDNALLRSPKAYLKDDAIERLNRLKKRIEETCQDDSFHIIEHILLRPLDEHYGPLLTPLLSNSTDSKWLDPYSFRISVVVPDWVERYRDEQQFYLFGQTLRAETPAHIAVGICRYNREQMLAFETAYYNVLVERSFPETDPENLMRVTNELVGVLNTNSSQCVSTSPQKPARPTCQ